MQVVHRTAQSRTPESKFFFSSIRRHTSLVSDWSSDVCSSDLGDVVAVEADGVGMVYVGVRPWLAIGAEALLERLGRGGGAQPRVAVHVRRAETCPADHAQGVILLEEELASCVER